MKLQDILTSDELKELKAIKPINNIIYAPPHIYTKIERAERRSGYKFKAIRGKK